MQYYSNMLPNVAEVADELQKEQWLGESGTNQLCHPYKITGKRYEEGFKTLDTKNYEILLEGEWMSLLFVSVESNIFIF